MALIRPVWRRHANGIRALRGVPECEVAVIGGGVTGLFAAAELAERGVDVVVLERDHVGAGASGRNAGFLLEGVSDCYASAVRTHGRELARELWALTAESHRLWVDLLGTNGGYRQSGSLTVAAGLEEARDLEASAQLLAEDGITVELLRGQVGPGFPREVMLLNPRDAEVDPVAAIQVIAVGLGARVHGHFEVHEIDSRGPGVRLRSSLGEVHAQAVLIATNAYTSDLVPAIPVRPVRAQMLATAPGASITAPRPVYRDRGFQYWRQLPDGRLLVGGYRNVAIDEEVGTDATPTSAVQHSLEDHLRRLGVEVPITHRWAGIMGFTPDGLPLAGRAGDGEGVYFCGGHNGHGMAMAPALARRLARALAADLGHSVPSSDRAAPAWADPLRSSLVVPA